MNEKKYLALLVLPILTIFFIGFYVYQDAEARQINATISNSDSLVVRYKNATTGLISNTLIFNGTDQNLLINKTLDMNFNNIINVGSITPMQSGTVVLLFANETDTSQTVKNTDTTLMTYSLASNSYSYIIVESEVETSFGVLSVPQMISIKIKDGTSTMETFTERSLAALGKVSTPIKISFVEQSAKTITITQSSALNDGQTTILIHSLRIYGVI